MRFLRGKFAFGNCVLGNFNMRAKVFIVSVMWVRRDGSGNLRKLLKYLCTRWRQRVAISDVFCFLILKLSALYLYRVEALYQRCIECEARHVSPSIFFRKTLEYKTQKTDKPGEKLRTLKWHTKIFKTYSAIGEIKLSHIFDSNI